VIGTLVSRGASDRKLGAKGSGGAAKLAYASAHGHHVRDERAAVALVKALAINGYNDGSRSAEEAAKEEERTLAERAVKIETRYAELEAARFAKEARRPTETGKASWRRSPWAGSGMHRVMNQRSMGRSKTEERLNLGRGNRCGVEGRDGRSSALTANGRRWTAHAWKAWERSCPRGVDGQLENGKASSSWPSPCVCSRRVMSLGVVAAWTQRMSPLQRGHERWRASAIQAGNTSWVRSELRRPWSPVVAFPRWFSLGAHVVVVLAPVQARRPVLRLILSGSACFHPWHGPAPPPSSSASSPAPDVF